MGNGDGNNKVDGSRRGSGKNGGDDERGHLVQGTVLTGSVDRELKVNVGLRQVVELISQNIETKYILRKLLYVNDLVVVADGEADLQEHLI